MNLRYKKSFFNGNLKIYSYDYNQTFPNQISALNNSKGWYAVK